MMPVLAEYFEHILKFTQEECAHSTYLASAHGTYVSLST
jgi:hypothetical protein